MATEPRLVNANAIKYREKDEYCGNGNSRPVRYVTKEDVAELPTVDAVEVVRCKDCTYWIDEDGTRTKDGITYARCNAHNHYVEGRHWGWCPSENDFCSFGERRKS